MAEANATGRGTKWSKGRIVISSNFNTVLETKMLVLQ